MAVYGYAAPEQSDDDGVRKKMNDDIEKHVLYKNEAMHASQHCSVFKHFADNPCPNLATEE